MLLPCKRTKKILWNMIVTVRPNSGWNGLQRLKRILEQLEITGRIETLQYKPLLRSARIFRRVRKHEETCHSNSQGLKYYYYYHYIYCPSATTDRPPSELSHSFSFSFCFCLWLSYLRNTASFILLWYQKSRGTRHNTTKKKKKWTITVKVTSLSSFLILEILGTNRMFCFVRIIIIITMIYLRLILLKSV